METRKAKLPDGSRVTWHMFYTDADGDPMALVEMAGGNVRNVHATWVEFESAQQRVHMTKSRWVQFLDKLSAAFRR